MYIYVLFMRFLIKVIIFIQFSIYFDISQDVNNKFEFTIKRIFLN